MVVSTSKQPTASPHAAVPAQAAGVLWDTCVLTQVSRLCVSLCSLADAYNQHMLQVLPSSSHPWMWMMQPTATEQVCGL